jgi:GNAT superfamily N-acetyltransferase
MNSAAARDRMAATAEIAIRLCREEDLSKLEWHGSFSHHRQIFREAYDLHQRGAALMLVAADGSGFPIGQAWLDFRRKPGWRHSKVWAVRVFAPVQGAGIGRRLMKALEEIARRRGETRLELGIEKKNEPARAFYERLGWRTDRETRESYGYATPEGQTVEHALDEWVMVKDLS